MELLSSKKLIFSKPEKPENYFNILIFHQNPQILQKISEIPFFNLIISGSELESLPKIEFMEENGFNVYRPGSTIITTFEELENKPKHVGIINIRRNEFQFEPIFLKNSHREILIKSLDFSSFQRNSFKNAENLSIEEGKKGFKGFEEDEAEHVIEEEIAGLLKEFHSMVFDRDVKKLPIIRLRVEYSGFDIVRIQRLENKFKNKVANEG